MELKIRPEIANDFKEIFELHQSAFGQEDESKLVDLLRTGETFIPELSIVAIHNNIIAGHILFTKIKIVDDNQHEYESLALAPMAVRLEFQKKGIGGQLIKHGLQIATNLNFNSVIVLGHDHYYPKFGFLPADTWGIKAPFDVPRNVFMGIELVKDGLKNVKGRVQYPKEFDAVS